MGSRTNTDIAMPTIKTRRRSNNRRICRLQKITMGSTTAVFNGRCSSSISDKLEALKSLIPFPNNGEVNADKLFQETADYILLLRTQVLILQELVDFYGPGTTNTQIN